MNCFTHSYPAAGPRGQIFYPGQVMLNPKPFSPGWDAALHGCSVSVARVTSFQPSSHPSWSVILAPDSIIFCDILISTPATDRARTPASHSALREPAGPGGPTFPSALTLACPPQSLVVWGGWWLVFKSNRHCFRFKLYRGMFLNFYFLVCTVGIMMPSG